MLRLSENPIRSNKPFEILTLKPFLLRSLHVASMQTCVSIPIRTAVSTPCMESNLCSTSETSIVNFVLAVTEEREDWDTGPDREGMVGPRP